jgi:hypothetical protein
VALTFGTYKEYLDISIEMNPSKTDSHSSVEEIPSFLQNLKVYCHVHQAHHWSLNQIQ